MLFGWKNNLEDFESAALPHLNDLYRTAVKLLGDNTRADDVIQDVYLKAWKSFHRFEPGTNCRAWLFKIMFNCIHDHRRRWMNTRMVDEPDEVIEQTLAAAPPVPERLEDGQILAALDNLPLTYREVVILADVEEMAYKEIAEILKIPMGTVMSRLSRGRGLLRATLAGVANSYGIGLKPAREQNA